MSHLPLSFSAFSCSIQIQCTHTQIRRDLGGVGAEEIEELGLELGLREGWRGGGEGLMWLVQKEGGCTIIFFWKQGSMNEHSSFQVTSQHNIEVNATMPRDKPSTFHAQMFLKALTECQITVLIWICTLFFSSSPPQLANNLTDWLKLMVEPWLVVRGILNLSSTNPLWISGR